MAEQALLSARGITKRFGRRTVLERVSLEVAAGEAVALVGENGAGKTTLLRICAGLLRHDGGDVRVAGRIGYCPQEPGLLDLLTASEHLVARDLSGGTRQKLNLALALLGEPRVLLLDEPYQGFDLGAYVNFWNHVDAWRREGSAVVVVTHLLAERERVDRVVELQLAA